MQSGEMLELHFTLPPIPLRETRLRLDIIQSRDNNYTLVLTASQSDNRRVGTIILRFSPSSSIRRLTEPMSDDSAPSTPVFTPSGSETDSERDPISPLDIIAETVSCLF